MSGVDPAVVSQWTAAAPDRFVPAPFIVEPARPGADAIRRELAAGRFRGIGEIATQLTGVRPNDPALGAVPSARALGYRSFLR